MLRLGHVCLRTKSTSLLKDFYVEMFGAAVVHVFRSATAVEYGYMCRFKGGGGIEILAGDVTSSTSAGRIDHCCVVSDDIVVLREYLRSHGVMCSEISRGRTDRVLLMTVSDPDGNIVEVHQYDHEATYDL